MKYLHRTMFVLIALVSYFVFNGEAGARSRSHQRHSAHHSHRHVAVVHVPKEVVKYIYITEKPVFPVTSQAAVAYPNADISELLSIVSMPYDVLVVAKPKPEFVEQQRVVIPTIKDDDYRTIVMLACIAAALVFFSISLAISIGDDLDQSKPVFLRIHPRTSWSRTTEVVRRSHSGWKTHRDIARLQVGNLIRRLREPFVRRTDVALSETGGSLITVLLQRLPEKYVKRFDISS